MGTHTLLLNFINNCTSHYKGILKNRILVAFQQPNFNLKSETKDHTKEVKLPEGPKRPLTSYFRFLSEHRPLVQKMHPEMKVVDLARRCAEDWKIIDPTLKEKYEKEYAEEAKVYAEKYKKFTMGLTSEQLTAFTKAKQQKRTNRIKRKVKQLRHELHKPKGPLSSYGYFIKEKRMLPENKNALLGNVLKRYMEEWSQLSKDEKNRYSRMYQDDRNRYEAEMVTWEKKMVQEGKEKLIRKESQMVIPSKKKEK
ncbi:hypothetical protein FQA39_LY01453 [Lamprigera yunnana]|nr:hypothetical protein FQA39_LY01453 [Lamprigera yunnana]